MHEHNENKDGLSVAAEGPDAAPRPHDHTLRIILHVAVLLGAVGLLIYACVWVPMHPGGY